MARSLLRLPTLILLAANLVPLVGVLFWHWDGFLLLMLYWMETAVIAFWTIVRILMMPAEGLSELKWGTGAQVTSRLGTAAFLHLPRRHLHGRPLPVPLGTVLRRLGDAGARNPRFRRSDRHRKRAMGSAPGPVHRARRDGVAWSDCAPLLLRLRFGSKRAAEAPVKIETILFGLYSRIFVLQVTIILGAWFATLWGGRFMLAVVILIKTAVDLALYAGIDLAGWGARPSTSRPAEVP